MWRGYRPLYQALPRAPYFHLVGASNACLAALAGTGGGLQNTLFLTLCNVPMQRAIATASAISPMMAFIASLGFITAGNGATDVPFGSIGYVNLPIAACLISTSMLTAPLGAKMVYRMPVDTLKKLCSGFTLFVSVEMLADAWGILL